MEFIQRGSHPVSIRDNMIAVETREVQITNEISLGGSNPLVIFAGPCLFESQAMGLEIATFLKDLCARLNFPLVFKASFDKANRTSLSAPRGPGLETGLNWLATVKSELKLPLITDIHTEAQAAPVAQVVDVLQIPAFLCRQTDLLVAAANTGKAIHIKKGQFATPAHMQYAVEKIQSCGNTNTMVCERGVSFGSGDLVLDLRNIVELRSMGIPTIYDATHSLQQPTAQSGETGGCRQYAIPLAKAAVACGLDGLFLEVHPDPSHALSDKATQLDFETAEKLLTEISKSL
jgi:2-dehydro-3-deoxyphosphooctonate aldolase (KDO 8-P synthase)